MKKVLFLIHDLGQGGAEKVLVNLVNNLDQTQYDVTVMTLFDEGENRAFLLPHVTYKYWKKKAVRGNSHLMKLFSPEQLHQMIVKDQYDIEVAYLEGPTARVISGCKNPKTKKIVWIHREQKTAQIAASSFRSVKEAERCYNSFDRIIGVSGTVIDDFKKTLHITAPTQVLYNTNESDAIRALATETLPEGEQMNPDGINLIGVGKLLKNKGFDRVIHAVSKLKKAGIHTHLYLLGSGPEEAHLREQAKDLELEDCVTLLGYQLNPYKYVAKADLFVCASYAEGFSTAATEALIVGTPVCTVEVSGMKEMLGENNEYGVVTENTEEALYAGLYELLSQASNLEHYKKQAKIRGERFSKEETVEAVQKMLEEV